MLRHGVHPNVSLKRIAVAAVLGLFTYAITAPEGPALAADNPIVIENQQSGSSAWRLTPGWITNDAIGQIKGYASATSVNQNESITLYVTVNPAQTYTIDFFRMGWYGGLGGRLLFHAGPLDGVQQSACVPDPTTGLIACTWAPSYTLAIPSDWTSGIYLALLTNAAGYQNYVMFVVRDGRPAPLLYQQGVMTDQAYNNYPDDLQSGKSLYGSNSYGANTVAGDRRAVKVSFDRPYSTHGAGLFPNWELQLVWWLERTGYDVTYSTDMDTHVNGGALLTRRGFIAGGHSEYWSREMRDTVEAARDAGVNLAFFGADAASVQVRVEASAAGVANRVIVCYKDARIDPVQGPTTTVAWRSPPVNRPEQPLRGIQTAGYVLSNSDYVVTNSSHWVYAGTGLRDGDVVPGIVGYEMDRFWPNWPPPNTVNQVILSHSPYTDLTGMPAYANSSIYQAPSGAQVFSSGTTSWSWGLVDFYSNLADVRIQRTTANILNAFLTGAPVVHDLRVTAPATVTVRQAFTLTVTAENTRGNPVDGYNGTVHFSSTDTAPGVLLPGDSILTNGQGTFSVTLATPGLQTVTVSDSANALTTTVSLTVNAAPASHLVLTTTATAIAGTAFTFTVTAQDPYGNTDPAYAGTVRFTSSNAAPGVVLPADSTLTNGQGTFSATLVRAGSQTITGADTATATIAGTLATTVIAAPANRLVLAPATATRTAGVALTFTVTAQDPYGNRDLAYAGTVHFTSTDTAPGVVLPADSTLTNGQRTFSATLVRTGLQIITGADTATATIAGSLTVNVRPASAAVLILSAPASTTVAHPFEVRVTLRDRFGNVATGYGGTVHFTSGDLLANLPANYTFKQGDADVFSVTLVTPPSQTITVTDTANASLAASSGPIAVGLF